MTERKGDAFERMILPNLDVINSNPVIAKKVWRLYHEATSLLLSSHPEEARQKEEEADSLVNNDGKN